MLLNIISKHKLMKKQILILSLFAALFFTSGCSPRILVREVVRDSLIVHTTLDSVYLYEKDSIFIKQKGDTVWLERWSIRYKDKLVEKKDTTYINNVEIKEVPVPAELNRWQRWQIRSFWWLFGVVAIVVAWQIIKLYFRLKR